MMIKQTYKVMATAIVASMVLTMSIVAPLSAQSTQGASGQSTPCVTPGQSTTQPATQTAGVSTGPDNAGAPLDCWLALGGHQSHWYKFRYGYNARTDKPAHQANIELAIDTADCFSFELWTPERLQAAKDDPSIGPVGTGTPKFMPVDPKSSSSKNQNQLLLFWSGSQNGSSTFYVIVKNRTDHACNYHLSITGASVFYPKPAKK